MNRCLFTSNSDEYATPDEIYNELNSEFNFNLDPCSTDENHKCDAYFTKNDNGLQKSWGGYTVFCNPPYSNISEWVKKSWQETSKEDDTTVVMLIPARTDTKYFQKYIYHRSEIRFLRGRLKFGGMQNSAPFPSMIVIFRSPR